MVEILNRQKAKTKDWRHLEFCTPIAETFLNHQNEFFIKGIAINETTTRNGITYISSELEKATGSFKNKPILVDHNNSIHSIVGRTTENINFVVGDTGKGRIDFEAKIMDKKMQEMINDGRIQNVSIGIMLEDLQENEETGIVTAIGMEGLEISLVAVPGDPGAGLAHAFNESLDMKHTLTKLQMEEKMAEEEKPETPAITPTEAPVEAPAEETTTEPTETATEEKLKAMEARLATFEKKDADIAAKAKFEAAVAEKVAQEMKKLEVIEASSDEDAPETPAEPEDETQGEVGGEAPAEDAGNEGYVVNRAESGKGFEISVDYTTLDGSKFKRLCR